MSTVETTAVATLDNYVNGRGAASGGGGGPDDIDPPSARAVMALREALGDHREEIAQLVTADMGKTIDDARGEVVRGIESTEAACAIPHLLKGENLEGGATGVDVELGRQPAGVGGGAARS